MEIQPGRVPTTRPNTFEMTILAQDPSVRRLDGRMLTARVRVPSVRLEPGPRSHRFYVIDYDASATTLHPPAVLTGADGEYQDRFSELTDEIVLNDRDFHAQQVYAVAARTLAVFEFALGRRVSWSVGGHELYLVPHAMMEPNAFYSDEDRSLLFGYFEDGRGGKVFTCLSYDIVAHETAHAVLDGLRHRFLEPALPDQAAFHEALADIVSLLSIFSLEEVVEFALGEPAEDGRISAAELTPEALRKNMLLVLAEQFGLALNRPSGGLRRSAEMEPNLEWRNRPAFDEPHRRGEILVAIVVQSLINIWTGRLKAITQDARVDRARAAEEGAKSADHLLKMCIRALDYLPPVEFEFEDFLDAILVSDAILAPDDFHDYRGTLKRAFGSFGILPFDSTTQNRFLPDSFSATYHNINWAPLRTDRDEVFRFLWENEGALGVNLEHYTVVESVRPSVRVGPDGLIVNEVGTDYVQMLELRAEEFAGVAAGWAARAGAPPPEVTLPKGLDPKTKIQLFGGGTLIFDQFGRAKYHVTKPLEDIARQTRRIEYLFRAGIQSQDGRLGASTGAPKGQRFVQLHRPDIRVGEEW
jgi:hypothetical protein